MAGDPPIIISGGSITIEFPTSVFLEESPQRGKFKNQNKVIRRIEISGSGVENFDAIVNSSDVVIKIHFGNR